MPSELSKSVMKNESQTSIETGGGIAHNSSIEAITSKSRYMRYSLDDPGFLVTFDQQAEVYDLLVHEEIQHIIFKIVGDKSFPDAKEAKQRSLIGKSLDMKRPYFVSGYEVESASGGKLYHKLFELKGAGKGNGDGYDSDHESEAGGLDLLSLKQIVRESYHLCNFAAKATVWEAA